MNPGLLIKLLRENKQISSEIMADLLGISINTYMKIESGVRDASVNEIQLIAEKFEVDPSFFLNKNGLNISGNNSPDSGVGNGNNITITVDQELQKAMLDTLTKLNKYLEKV